MTDYARLYRWGLTPWERYRDAAATSLAPLLDVVESTREGRRGRALDLGCGRGLLTPLLAERGWDATGVDVVPAAIEAAKEQGATGVQYLVGDVTQLESLDLGQFDLFLDVGCFQGFDDEQRRAEGRGVTALAAPGATLLVLAFGPSRFRSFVGGVSRDQVVAGFPEWELRDVRPAPTEGLGWPMNRTAPQWYRFERPSP